MFRQGALSALTNPKALLFFAAFLPQFIDPARSLWLQFLVMAGTFALIEVLTELLIARAAHRISPWLCRCVPEAMSAPGRSQALIAERTARRELP